MRISDWSSDVCSSDLVIPQAAFIRPGWAGKAPALIGGTVGGATETARELSGDGQIDPFKVGMAASAGALMQRPTRLGRAVGVQIGRAHVELQSLMRNSYAVFCLKK